MKFFPVTLAFLVAIASNAEDVVTIESTISGNSEQPKLLTIVPWKEPGIPDYLGEEVDGIGETIAVFQTIDRQSFNRERRYLETVRQVRHK